LVRSRDAGKWFATGRKEANYNKMKKFSKNPALAAYLNSLVNRPVLDGLDVAVGQEKTIRLRHHHAEVVRFGPPHRLGQRPEVGLPGVVRLS
jgi:hypothetical protein